MAGSKATTKKFFLPKVRREEETLIHENGRLWNMARCEAWSHKSSLFFMERGRRIAEHAAVPFGACE